MEKRRMFKHLVETALCITRWVVYHGTVVTWYSNEVVLLPNHAWYKQPHFSHGVDNLLGFSGCQALSPPLISADWALWLAGVPPPWWWW